MGTGLGKKYLKIFFTNVKNVKKRLSRTTRKDVEPAAPLGRNGPVTVNIGGVFNRK